MRCTVHLAAIAVLFHGATLFNATFAAEEIHVIELKHRSAEEIAPVVRPLLGAADGLSGTNFRLIVRTSDKRFSQIQRLVRTLDVARRSLTLTIKRGVVLDETRARNQVSGDVRVGGGTRIALPSHAAGNSGEVTVSRRDSDKAGNLRYRTKRIATSKRDENLHVLRVLDGQRAFVRIGQSQPQVQKTWVLSDRHETRVGGVQTQEVSTGFEILPRVNGDRVHLEITSRLSTAQDPAVGAVNFQQLTTTVSARLGEWIDLGAVTGTNHDISRALLGSLTVHAGEQRTVLIKVEYSK